VNGYVGPRYCRAEMYAGRVACCSLLSHVEYAPRAMLKRKTGQTYRRTDRTDGRQVNAASITACTVVQAVVKATSQSNGKGQILTPWGSETAERILMKLGIYNRVAGMPTHANPCGAATTWVVWANT